MQKIYYIDKDFFKERYIYGFKDFWDNNDYNSGFDYLAQEFEKFLNENYGSWSHINNSNIEFIRIIEKDNMIYAYCGGSSVFYHFDKNKSIAELFMNNINDIKRIVTKFDTAMLILVE